ncbi:fibronectin type III domain protein [Ancylostoma ceylanicum]|uniref:receptor protein-tyrosine kinase n=1 Tax=Ancylostoma ceylanicum TaxID=53326 RepID=A0A0D6LZL2_9BILA|nr:fibronectin type III domain protein [Ancylostoma ceylanicum]
MPWKAPSNASFDPSVIKMLVLINGLLSATSYDYRFVAAYSGTYLVDGRVITFKEYYYQGVQQAKTKAGVPTAPLEVEARNDDEGWTVSWRQPASDGGSPITSYAVEMRYNRSSEWEIAERGLDGMRFFWRLARNDRRTWEFRVRAANTEGFGAYGYSSDDLGEENVRTSPTADDSAQSWLYVILSVSMVAILILLTLIFLMIRARTRAERLKKQRTQDKNCITLEKIACLNHVPTQPMPQEILNEIKNLPHVRSEFVRLERKLGTGSFGEVWEGVATRLPMREVETRVAVKTLRQECAEAEKIKFMKEAILMNNFDHPNIVKLLGVCLEGHKDYIILELMEGGDLLNFLRASSPTDSFPSQLSLRDILSMLIDVGRGGAYLESNRHVHRDLAARNCLISSRAPHPHRVTKIADFGLARDVYNSDYYKVHGEDFLPLRWLAPECIMEGVFSSKSDVWAFGILMYEIVGLGQKPYPSMENSQLCWAYEREQRPTFADILSMFEKLRDKIEFQDDKPYPPCGGHYNVAFDLSQDSTSSEKMDSEKGVSNQGFYEPERLSEQTRFGLLEKQSRDKSNSGSVSARKTSLIRSLRKESKAKQYLGSDISADGSTRANVARKQWRHVTGVM